MNCPKCDSSEIRRSSRIKWSDPFHFVLGQHAFRCRKCRVRFYAVSKTTPDDAPAAKRMPRKRFHISELRRNLKHIRPWMWEAAIFGFMLLIFLVFLRYLTREPSAGPEGSRVMFTSDFIHS